MRDQVLSENEGMERIRREVPVYLTGLSIAFCCPLLIYAASACRTVYWGDTGEFLVAAIRLGIPHSPGTPLYPLLGRCCSLLLPGNQPLAVNLMSGFFSALSGAAVYVAVVLLMARGAQSRYATVGGALTASLVWTSTHSLWSYSTVAEVYTLQMAFVGGLVCLGVRMSQDDPGGPRLVPFFFFLCGLSLSNNITVLLLIPGLLILVWPALRRVGRNLKALSAALFLFGVTPYLYMPFRSIHDPPIDWGNPETFSQFLWVLSAREFARNMLGLEYAVTGGFIRGMVTYTRLLLSDITLVGIAVSLIGMAICFRLTRRVFVALLVIYGTTLAYSFAFGADLELEAYLLPSLMSIVLFLGVGAVWIGTLGRRLFRTSLTLMLLLLPAVLFVTHYAERDLSGNNYAEHVGRSLLTSMEENGLYFTDNTVDLFTVLYAQSVTGYRQDVSLVYLPYLKYGWYRQQVEKGLGIALSEERDGWLDLVKTRASYYTPLSKSLLPASLLLPDGLRFKVSEDPLTDDIILNSAQRLADFDLGSGTRDYDTRRHFALIHSYVGEYFYLRERYAISAGEYEKAAKMMPENCEIRLNLASAKEKAGELDEALEHYRACMGTSRDRLRVLRGLGRVSLAKRDFSGARESFLAAVSLEGSDASIHYNLGLAELGIGDLEAAAQANLKAVELKPDFAEALTNLGVSYAGLGRRREAVLEFGRAIAADSSFVRAYLNLALLYVSADSVEKAEQVLRAGVKSSGQSSDYHLLTTRLKELAKVSK